ncbi:MAG: HEPN domain-containing protein [Anaerolineae bacterium]|nr:HEPN domain-containing protein [Anaerolineae bacterium]
MRREQRALIRYRLDMAWATLNDARVLLDQGGSFWSVVNRAYYAIFYAALALLITIGKAAAKHSGVIALFDQHFVKTGHFPREMSQWLHKAFDLRQIADYRELVSLTEEQVLEVMQWAEAFVQEVEQFLSAELAEGEADAG